MSRAQATLKTWTLALAAALSMGAFAAAPRLAEAQGKGSGGGKEKPPDEVFLKAGDSKKGEITAEGTKELTLKLPNDKTQKMEWKEIDRVVYGGNAPLPPSVTAAEALVDRRDYTRAAREAEDAMRDCQSERQRKLFLPRAKLALARAKSRLGNGAEAAKLCEEIVGEAAESRYAPAAWAERVIALANAGDASVEKVGKDAQDKAGDDFILPNGQPAIEEADLALAAYYEKKEKTLEAKTIYAKHEGAKNPAVRERASLGRARIAIKEKQFDSARTIFTRLANEAKDPDAIAGALVGLGDASMEEADKADAKTKPTSLRKAFMTYLKAVVLAAPTGAGSSDNHENALRRAGQCAEKILGTLPQGKPDTKEEKARKYFTDYARRLYEELVLSYPSAADAKELTEKAKKMKEATKTADAPK